MDRIAVVGMDLHRDFSKVAMLGEDGKVMETKRIEHGDHGEMARFFNGLEDGTDVVMEAGFNWPWVADLAEAAGLTPHLGQGMRCRDLAKGMAKNDRKDAIFLGKLWLAGGDVFPEAYLAPQAVRAMRAKFRTRSLFVTIRAQLKNSIHGILFKCGRKFEGATDMYGKRGREALKRLELPKVAREEMDRKLGLTDDLGKHIAAIEERICAELPSDKRAGLLQTMPGIGVILAYGMLAEIGEIGRFPDRRALASYAGVLPLDNESAGEDHGKRTNRYCNRALRWMALEAAQGAIKGSWRMRSLFNRVKARHPSRPGMALVAVAREILEVVHLLLARGVPYMENPPPRPGSVPGKASCRSEYQGTRGSRRASQIAVCAAPARVQAER